ncbi:MAG TPA: 5-oxoprolinase subunit PxpA [Candidatus Dormibacteraeota bacterium]|nr:5-oxoprolinase subunit PxpA [Candidatus Dormibacteraeota bacterium]
MSAGSEVAPRTVDLNCDAGEGFGPWRMADDDALLDVVTTVSIACGFHAGDPLIMRRTVAAAVLRGVAVGAHPGTNDLWGFGRRGVAGEDAESLATMVVYQVGALAAIAQAEGARLTHVKLHGALSNAAAADAELASAVASALRRLDASLAWLVPCGSAMAAAGAAAGLRTVGEAFADRGYTADGRLVDRRAPGAVLDDPDVVASRAVAMLAEGGVRAGGGEWVPLAVESLCVHGDSPNAVAAALAARRALERAGVEVRRFA